MLLTSLAMRSYPRFGGVLSAYTSRFGTLLAIRRSSILPYIIRISLIFGFFANGDPEHLIALKTKSLQLVVDLVDQVT